MDLSLLPDLPEGSWRLCAGGGGRGAAVRLLALFGSGADYFAPPFAIPFANSFATSFAAPYAISFAVPSAISFATPFVTSFFFV